MARRMAHPPGPAATTPTPIWFWNGRLVAEPAVTLSPRDRGLRYGDGLYETLRVHRGSIVRLAEHLARMAQGLALLDLDLDPHAAFGAAALAELVARNGLAGGEGRLRLLVTRGADQGSARPTAGAEPTRLAHVEPLPPGAPPSDPRSLRLQTVAQAAPRPTAWAGLKSLNHLPYVLAAAAAARAGADEALLVYEGWVKETTAANVFLVRGGTIVTPPTSEGILAGVTRDLVIELARAQGLPLTERPIASAEVAGAEEIFTSGSVSGIRGIAAVDGRPIGTRVPGPLTRVLRDAYAAALAAQVGAA
jgi:branched-subunit amino acid aminotransferase/4-amino-4-deoxychorismate lyase